MLELSINAHIRFFFFSFLVNENRGSPGFASPRAGR